MNQKTVQYLLIVIGILLLIAFATSRKASAESLAPFSGNWVGTATVNLESGKTERQRCKAINGTLSSGRFNIILRCSTGVGPFELRSNLVANGRTVSGTWSETSYKNHGTISGSLSSTAIDGKISGPVVRGTVRVSRVGNMLHIRASLSHGVRSISITMNRGS